MALALLQRDHGPANVRHDLPVPQRRPIHGATGAPAIFIQKVRSVGDAADGIAMPPEAPAFGKEPADVLQRIAPRDEFPVEHARERAFVHQVITRAVIAVYESGLFASWRVSRAPAQAPLQ